MGGGFIGTSSKDRAMDKMIKFMDKSDRHTARHGKKEERAPGLVEQLKEMYPTTWRDQLSEMILERDTPGYLESKQAAKKKAYDAYWAQPRHVRSDGPGESRFIINWVKDWRERYLADNGIEAPVIRGDYNI